MSVILPDRVFVGVASAPGTGTVTLGAALPAYQRPKDAAFTSGLPVPYTILDGISFETGQGIYAVDGSGVETITRGLRQSSTGALLNLSANAQIMISPGAQDLVMTRDLTSITRNLLSMGASLAALRAAGPLNLPNGWSDAFSDQTGIDAANSTGLSIAAGDVSNTTAPVTAAYPNYMTGDNTPASDQVTAYNGAASAWNAVDGDPGTAYVDGNGLSTQSYWMRKLSSAQVVTRLDYTSNTNVGAQGSLRLEGSNDNSTWTTLVTGIAPGNAGVPTTYNFTNSTAYLYLRLRTAVASNDYAWQINEAKFYILTPGSTRAATLRSVNFAAPGIPTKGMMQLIAKAPGGQTIVPGTNISAKLSRDAGTTYGNFNLALLDTLPDGSVVLEDDALDLSALGSGQTLKAEIDFSAAFRVDVLRYDVFHN